MDFTLDTSKQSRSANQKTSYRRHQTPDYGGLSCFKNRKSFDAPGRESTQVISILVPRHDVHANQKDIDKAFIKINNFAMLPYNWDGFGAVQFSMHAIRNAITFLNMIPYKIATTINSDSVTPTPHGTIVIDFENKSELISVEIGNKNIGFFTEFEKAQNITLDSKEFNPKELPIELDVAFATIF